MKCKKRFQAPFSMASMRHIRGKAAALIWPSLYQPILEERKQHPSAESGRLWSSTFDTQTSKKKKKLYLKMIESNKRCKDKPQRRLRSRRKNSSYNFVVLYITLASDVVIVLSVYIDGI